MNVGGSTAGAARRSVESATGAKAESMVWPHKHLLGLEDLSAEEITFILDTAEAFEDVSSASKFMRFACLIRSPAQPLRAYLESVSHRLWTPCIPSARGI